MDSSAIYYLRQLALAGAVAAAVGGCGELQEDGTDEGAVTFRDEAVPFTFRHPATFTEETVDSLNSRGDVVAVRALDKTSVLAVRRVGDRLRGTRETRLEVLGRPVTSRVTAVGRGWALECQWTADRRERVLEACERARATLRFG